MADVKGIRSNGRDIYSVDFADYLPETLKRDPKMKALAAAVTEQMLGVSREIDNVLIYSRIDELPEELIDILAFDMHVDWYDYSYPLAAKRDVLKNSVKVHKKMGTKYAIEKGLSGIYPISKVEEWFEYGGEPFYFKVILDAEKGKVPIQNLHEVIRMIGLYKRLSAHLDTLELRYYFHVLIYYKNAVLVHINFWPRYPLTLLKLSGDWKLDGSHRLSGYNTDEYVDYYPVRTAAKIIVPVTVNWDAGASARPSAKLGTDYCMDVSARSAACIRVPGRSYDNVQAAAYTSVQAAPTVSDGNVQIINRLTGKWKLDGSRKLNAGVYPL